MLPRTYPQSHVASRVQSRREIGGAAGHAPARSGLRTAYYHGLPMPACRIRLQRRQASASASIFYRPIHMKPCGRWLGRAARTCLPT